MNNKETVEEAANKSNGYNLYAKGTKGQAFNEGFIGGAKWQAERMYSEEDMISFGEFMQQRHTGVRESFEQFKKKHEHTS